MYARYIGIDPGVKGAIASIDSTNTYTEPLKHSKYEPLTTLESMANKFTIICVEKVQPRPSNSLRSIVTSCKNWGRLQAHLELLDCAVIYITPQEWQKDLRLRRYWKRPKNITDDKWQSMKYNMRKQLHKKEAIKLFPELRVTLINADALLIAHYIRLKNDR